MRKRPSRLTFQSRLDEMVGLLRSEIRSGKRADGEFLPPEKDMAAEYRLSNQSVRKGLEVLVAEGLIEKIPRVGNKVIAPALAGNVTVKLCYQNTIPGETGLPELLARFRTLYPHINVQEVVLPTNSLDIITQYMDNGMLDVVTINQTLFRELRETGNLGRLQRLEANPDVYPFLTEAFRAEGELLLQPFIFSPVVMCYNREHFLDKQVPEPDSSWTWRHMLDLAARLEIPKERVSLAYLFYSINRFPLLFLQHSLTFDRDGGGKRRIDRSKMSELLRLARTLKEKFPILFDGSIRSDIETEQLFMQNKASIILTTYFRLNSFKDAEIPFELSPIPHMGDPKTLLVHIGLGINRNTEVQEAARTLVEFLTSYETQLAIRRNTYSLPALKPAAEWVGEETLSRSSRFSMFREIFPTLRTCDDLQISEADMKKLVWEMRMHMAGFDDEEQFCTRLEEQLM
ncbi:extracellular solute-binding protein [Paenibacillus oceani]|uniref:Extracellular solute-binding protein n=1 Tax=Paenibacillus oceani TaxID=2772510 RepID=A0A927H0I5_9BACL|nr:extracellular solute-binding protein [Paenibacillus oceani]MBD2862519.1 extracellular solute-binding protein [Paenibacillus oceani]